MRLIKMLGLAALTAVAAMAFVGASTASAESTVLCKTTEDPCSEANQITSQTLKNVGVGLLLNSTADVLCLNVESKATPLVNTSEIHVTAFTYTGCGTTSTHNNCEVTTEELPLITILLLELFPFFHIKFLSGKTRVKCTIGGFIKINCLYDNKNIEFGGEDALENAGSGHGMLTAEKSPATLLEGGGLCPEKSSLDGLVEPTEHTYVAMGTK